ncbi:MAG: DUF2254 domain-containing protein [Gammaproteobacteria bacterium]
MKTRILNLIEMLRGTFWTLPLLLLLLSIVLAVFNIYLDMSLFREREHLHQLLYFFSDAEHNRVLIATTAGSILGVAGVSFSVTIASLTLASQQFGPRLLRNFMQDSFNQFVIGVFTATFLYCILILQFISNLEEAGFVPVISLSTLLGLVVFNLMMLVFFIHHISTSIQADSIIAEVYSEMVTRLRNLFPEELQDEEEAPEEMAPAQTEMNFMAQETVCAARSGYLQAIDVEGLLKLVTHSNAMLNLDLRPGDFILYGSPLGWVCSEEKELPETLHQEIQNHLFISDTRTAQQDAEFAIRQLVEIALRALSPGINDPFTAIACIDRLGDAIAFLMKRRMPRERYLDEDGRLRLRLKEFSFHGITEAAFNQIRQNAGFHVAIIMSLLEILGALAEQANNQEQAEAIMVQADAIFGACEDEIKTPKDWQDIDTAYRRVASLLGDYLSVEEASS